MPGPETYHSSMRRCDLYDNPYNTQMQAHPSIVKQRQETFASRDSISSAQKKLENELFEAFKQHSMQIFSGKFFIIGQAGKYAFLAIMLPTYLFFYGIPKWLLTEAAPTVYDFSKRIVANAGSKIGSAVSHVATAAFGIVRTVTDPILNFIQTRIEKAREFYHNVKQRIEQITRSTLNALTFPFRAINQKFIQPVVNVYRKFAETAQSIRQKFVDFAAFLKETRGKIRKTLIEFPNKVAEALMSLPDKFKEFSAKMKQPFEPLANAISNLDHKLQEVLKKAVEVKNQWMNTLVYKPAAEVKDAYQTIKERVLSLVHQAVDPLVNWAKPKMDKVVEATNSLKEHIKEVKESVSSNIRKISDKINETVKRYTEETGAIKQDIAQILPQPVIAFFTPIALTAGWMINAPRRLFRFGKNSRGKIERLKEKLQVKLVRLHQRLLSFLKKGYQRAKPKCIAFAKKTKRTLIAFFKVLKEMLKGAFYMLRMMFAWLKVLFKHGMFLVKEACAELLPRLYRS